VSAQKLPDRILKFVRKAGVSVKIEDSTQWLNSAKQQPRRLRVIGQVDLRLPELANPDVAIYSGEQTESGIIELLPFFKEQAVSITAHRFGNPARHLSLLRL
jgi:RHH-type proline utilization regulon transcriptional repressor/proline dehydrogenase/delta 1-pyrroline-5-carboxylate dehydrogenase